MDTISGDDWKPINVALPARYWITVLALADQAVREVSNPQLEKLKRDGKRLEDIPDELKAAISGPIFVRAEIVKALHHAGVMTAEANFQHGTDALLAMIKRIQNEKG